MIQQVETFGIFIATVGGIGLALSPLIQGLVNSIKEAELINTKYLTIVAWVIGTVIGILISYVAPGLGDPLTLGIAGLVGGLIATKNYNKIADEVYTKIEKRGE